MAGSDELSKTQIDRLGDRLRNGNIHEDDLRLLDIYRRSFGAAYEDVVGQIRDQLGLEPTGRPAKSTTSISEKLRRESIRLSQMQDTAGCRVTVTDLPTQNEVVARLKEHFERVTVIDRRERPSHGYRAVHVVVESRGMLIEIQVRTLLQHLWAELSEKISDVVDNAIKYGGGNKEIVSHLGTMSDFIRTLEASEDRLHSLTRQYGQILSSVAPDETNQRSIEMDQQVEKAREVISREKESVAEMLNQTTDAIARLKGQEDALSG